MSKNRIGTIKVKITGPDCWVIDRHYQPGETATVPAHIAQEWITTGRATSKVAEVDKWQPEEA